MGQRQTDWELGFNQCRLHHGMQVLQVCDFCAFSSPPAFPPCSCPLAFRHQVRRMTYGRFLRLPSWLYQEYGVSYCDARPGRWSTADPSNPTTVSMATAAIRAGVSSHTGLMAAGGLLHRKPGATGLCCA